MKSTRDMLKDLEDIGMPPFKDVSWVGVPMINLDYVNIYFNWTMDRWTQVGGCDYYGA
jgi:hypothetical protein